MQYIEYVKLGLALVGLIVDIVKDIKGGTAVADPAHVDSVSDRILASVKGIGGIAGNKELADLDVADMKPLVVDLVSKVRDLRAAHVD